MLPCILCRQKESESMLDLFSAERICWPHFMQKKSMLTPYCAEKETMLVLLNAKRIFWPHCAQRIWTRERDREWWLDYVQREGVANFILREHAGFTLCKIELGLARH